MKILSFLKILVCFLLFVCVVEAQNQDNPDRDEQIFFNVAVTTKNGEPVKRLKAGNFNVYHKKKLQPISFFSAKDAPASIGILVDTSESAGLIKIPALERVLTEFVTQSHPDNEYFLMTFGESHEILLDITQGDAAVTQAFKKLSNVKYEGNTAFFDAVIASAEKLSAGRYAKKVLVILSDASDNSSKNNFTDLRKTVRQTGVLLYNINVMTASDTQSISGLQAQAYSEHLTELSGGRTIYPRNLEEMQKAFLQTAEELRSQYVIGIRSEKPAEKKKKSEWREIEIKLESTPDFSVAGKTTVRTRKGYYSN